MADELAGRLMADESARGINPKRTDGRGARYYKPERTRDTKRA